MDDLISRQDAIDAIRASTKKYTGFMEVEMYTDDDAVEAINNLPPAQPEQAIKDCRNCKHGRYNDHWDTYFCYCPNDCNDWDKWEPSTQPSEIQDILNYLDTVLHPIISPEHWNVYSELFDMISTLPSAEMVGKWIGSDDFDEYYRCSECGKGETQFGRLYRYCPWCGARMRGEENERIHSSRDRLPRSD